MRIISGKFRGRKLLPPKGLVTRPITDRVKESLFNILSGDLEDAVVADIFCGTGSMGLESISRGAKCAYFADRDARAIGSLKNNIEAMDILEQCSIWRGDITKRLSTWLSEAMPLDIAFLDPPYPMATQWQSEPKSGQMAARQVFDPLCESLSESGVIIFRTPKDLPAPEYCRKLQLSSRREYGSMAINFLTAIRDSDTNG